MWNPWDATPRTLDPSVLQWLAQNQQGGDFGGFRYQPQYEWYDGSSAESGGPGLPPAPLAQWNRIKLDEQGNPIGRDQEAYKPDGNYSHSWIESGGSWLDKNGWVIPLAMMGVTNPGMFGLGGTEAAAATAGGGGAAGGISSLGQLPALTASQTAALSSVPAMATGSIAPLAGGAAGLGLGTVASVGAGLGGAGGLLGSIGDALGGGGLRTAGQLLGGIAGALDSRDGETEQKNEPWGPAQGWIKDNMQRGQQLQQQLQAQPFTQNQQAAYGNLFGLLNSANQGAGGLLGNVTNVANNQFDRSNPRKRAAPMQGLMGFNPTTYGG